MYLHYCWFGKTKKSRKIKRCIKSWKKIYPDFKIIEWNETNFDIRSAPCFVQESYNKENFAFVADYVRAFAMYKYGGLYLDTDMLAIKRIPFDMFNNNFLGLQGPGEICCGIIYCKKNNNLFKTILENYNNVIFREDVSYILDWIERFFNGAYKTKVDKTVNFKNFVIYDSSYFLPKRWNWSRSKFQNKNTYFVHLFLSSWKTKKYSFKNKLFHLMCLVFGTKLAYKFFRRNCC